MLLIKKLVEPEITEKYKDMVNDVLGLLPQVIPALKWLELSFVVEPYTRRKNRLYIESNALPKELLGIWSHSVRKMNIELISGDLDSDKEEVNFLIQFRYEHHGGGSNGHGIYTEDGQRFTIRYNLNSKSAEIIKY